MEYPLDFSKKICKSSCSNFRVSNLFCELNDVGVLTACVILSAGATVKVVSILTSRRFEHATYC